MNLATMPLSRSNRVELAGLVTKIKQFALLPASSLALDLKDLGQSVDQPVPFLHCPDVEPHRKVSDERPKNPRFQHVEYAQFWQPIRLRDRPSHAAHEEYR